MAAKVWDIVPRDIKDVNDIEDYKNNIRKWESNNCHCKLYLDYVSRVRCINTF